MKIQSQHQSKNHRSRNQESVEFLVLHYTAVPLGTTLGIFTNNAALSEEDAEYFNNSATDPKELCKNEVSAHYVVAEDAQVFQLVDEQSAAYHAGVSFWNGVKNLNNKSIGIEHVNLGFDWLKKFPAERAQKVAGDDRTWCEFTAEQIASTIELCQNIIKKHNIKPYNIVGHSDIACGRKSDPGPLFPWQQLAAAGIGLWFDIKESKYTESAMAELKTIQQMLRDFGYDCPQSGTLDDATKNVIKALQMHFRPTNIDGKLDLETVQILDSLCQRKTELKIRQAMAATSVTAQRRPSSVPLTTESLQQPTPADQSMLAAFRKFYEKNTLMVIAATGALAGACYLITQKFR